MKNSESQAVTLPEPSMLARMSMSVGGGVLVAVAAVAARAFHIDAAHVVRRYAEHGGELLAQVMGRLRGRPRGQLAVLELGDRAGRADRAVGVDGEVVGRLERPGA